MSEDKAVPCHVRYTGLAVAVATALVLVLAWIFVLPILDGTWAEELKYVVYAVFAAGVLSGAHWVEDRLVSHRPVSG